MVRHLFFHQVGALINDKAAANGTPSNVALVTGTDTVDLVAEKTIAFFTSPGKLSASIKPEVITSANVAALKAAGKTKEFIVVQGTPVSMPGGKILVSPPIQADGIRKLVSKTYAAPVNQVVVVGDDGAANGSLNVSPVWTRGDVYPLKIVVVAKGIGMRAEKQIALPDMIYSFEYVVTASDEALASAVFIAKVVNELVAQINAHPDANITAAALGTPVEGLSLTANAQGMIFRVVTYGELESADIQYDNALGSAVPAQPVQGSGTYLQVNDLELNAIGHQRGDYRGITDIRRQDVKPQQLVQFATPGVNYDVHVLDILTTHKGSYWPANEHQPMSIHLVVDTTLLAAQKTELNNILAGLI